MASQTGLWGFEKYKPVQASSLHENPWDNQKPGYRVISGEVEHISESRSSIWINLKGNVALRIKREDLHYFEEPELRGLRGKIIQARGWIYKKGAEYRIRIRHNSDMMIIK